MTSTHDFYATHEALRLAAAKVGAQRQRIPLYDDPPTASAGEIVDRIRAAIRPATRLVALTWVHSSTGVKLPSARSRTHWRGQCAAATPPAGSCSASTRVHGLGAEAAGPAELGCDMFISGTHKWLFGPRGTGIVWIRRDAWDRMTAVIPTFSGPSFGNWFDNGNAPFVFGLDGTPGGFHSFEHRWALTDAFGFHQTSASTEWQRGPLSSRPPQGRSCRAAHVGLVTPRDPGLSSGVVCCDVTGRPPARWSKGCGPAPDRRERDAVPDPYVRFGPSIVTSPEQVDSAIQALAEMT